MTIAEWWWEYDLRTAEAGPQGGFSGAEWDRARAEHARKMTHDRQNR